MDGSRTAIAQPPKVYMIGREQLLDIARLFPETYALIRRRAVLLSLRRELISAAKRLKGLREDQCRAGVAVTVTSSRTSDCHQSISTTSSNPARRT